MKIIQLFTYKDSLRGIEQDFTVLKKKMVDRSQNSWHQKS